MSFNWPQSSTPSRPISVSGGVWGVVYQDKQKDEALFNSLLPVGGTVSGEQVKPVFQASQLPRDKLAQIWSMVDSDHDGRINISEFCAAMGLMRQAKQEGFPVQQSRSGQFFQTPAVNQQFTVPSTPPPTSPHSNYLYKSWTLPSKKHQSSVGGVGRGVSLNVVSEGWAMKPHERRKYVMQFHTYDKNRTGFLSGVEMWPILSKSGLDQPTLARIWGLSDMDKDGRLSVDEFAVAMHLIEKSNLGLALPETVPPELRSGKAERTRKLSEDSAVTFEDKAKENFEYGRMELERRRKAQQEKQEKELAERERRRQQEEERRQQQELEAQKARQAELERQQRIAMKIVLEREHQMELLARKREAELLELERKKKEEQDRRKQQELQELKKWEMKSLKSLAARHQELEQQLNQLDQQKIALSASVGRQRMLCTELENMLRSLKLSRDVRKAELSKLQSELGDFQVQLSSLGRLRKELQLSLQSRSPEAVAFQQRRQQYCDSVIGLAASLAGLRSTFKYNTETSAKQKETFVTRNSSLEELKSAYHSEEVVVHDLRVLVGARKKALEDHERRLHEAVEMERKEQEEKERLQRMIEERAQREARVARIHKEQEEALRKERERREAEALMRERERREAEALRKERENREAEALMRERERREAEALRKERERREAEALMRTQDVARKRITEPPESSLRPVVSPMTAQQNVSPHISPEPIFEAVSFPVVQEELLVMRTGMPPVPQPRGKEKKVLEKEVMRKVKELQKRKVELQKQKEQQNKEEVPGKRKKRSPPIRPAPYSSRQKSPLTDPPLVDLLSSWDSSAQTASVPAFQKDNSEILQPMKSVSEPVISTEEIAGEASPLEPQTHEQTVGIAPEGLRMSWFEKTKARFELSSVQAGEGRYIQAVTEEPVADVSHMQDQEAVTDLQTDKHSEESAVQYRALYDFDASDSTEVSFREGDILSLRLGIEGSPGWVMVDVKGAQGWAPVLYLEQLDGEVEGEQPGDGVAEQPAGDGVAEQPGDEVAEQPAGDGVAEQPGDEFAEQLRILEDGSEQQVEVEDGLEQQPERVLSPPHAQVIYTWEGSKVNHLSIQRGAIVTVLQQKEKWWSGELSGKVGWFPRSYVRLLEDGPKTPEKKITPPSPPSLKQPEEQQLPTTQPEDVVAPSDEHSPTLTLPGEEALVYEAVYDYDGEAEGDLSFKAGDLIQVETHEGEWWTGVLNGERGIFPSNYVQTSSPTQSPTKYSQTSSPVHSPVGFVTSTSSEATNVIVHSKPLIARVIVAFHALQEGQLNLTPGEFIKIRKQAKSGWWEGELQSRGRQRQAGWFPSNRVEMLARGRASSSTSSLRAKSPLMESQLKPSHSSQTLVLALYSYVATSPDELNFHKGSVISVLSKEEGEWWKGELNGQVGLFPSNYVQPLTEQQPASEATRWADSVSPDVLSAVSDQERKRQEAIFELLSSERNYVDSLKLVKEVFFDPMSESGVLTEEEVRQVRVNWDELITCNTDLLNTIMVRLRTSGAVVRNIGDVLVNQIPKLQSHIRWCSCQLNACTLLQSKASDPQFKEFEQQCTQDPRTGGLPLSSFLLKPMQRITKYPLLITRILDYTPDRDLDSDELRTALEFAKTLCTHVNEAVRSKENTEQLEWLQMHVQFTLDENLVFNSQTNFMGSRKLLHHGKLFKIRGAKDLVGFLFNDFFLLVKPKLLFPRAATPADLKAFGENEFLMYRKPFLLEGLRVKTAPTEHYGPSVFLLLHTSEEKDIPLRADSDTARDQWVKKITKAGLEYVTTKKKMEREKKEELMRTLKDSVGQLKVKVVEAADLQASDPNGKSDPFCVVRLGNTQEQKTAVIPATLNPKWNHKMQFAVYDINKDILEITVFDKDLFSPNDFLGSTKLALKDLMRDGNPPWTKRLLLEDVPNGEIELELVLVLNKSHLLL